MSQRVLGTDVIALLLDLAVSGHVRLRRAPFSGRASVLGPRHQDWVIERTTAQAPPGARELLLGLALPAGRVEGLLSRLAAELHRHGRSVARAALAETDQLLEHTLGAHGRDQRRQARQHLVTVRAWLCGPEPARVDPDTWAHLMAHLPWAVALGAQDCWQAHLGHHVAGPTSGAPAPPSWLAEPVPGPHLLPATCAALTADLTAWLHRTVDSDFPGPPRVHL